MGLGFLLGVMKMFQVLDNGDGYTTINILNAT